MEVCTAAELRVHTCMRPPQLWDKSRITSPDLNGLKGLKENGGPQDIWATLWCVLIQTHTECFGVFFCRVSLFLFVMSKTVCWYNCLWRAHKSQNSWQIWEQRKMKGTDIKRKSASDYCGTRSKNQFNLKWCKIITDRTTAVYVTKRLKMLLWNITLPPAVTQKLLGLKYFLASIENIELGNSLQEKIKVILYTKAGTPKGPLSCRL